MCDSEKNSCGKNHQMHLCMLKYKNFPQTNPEEFEKIISEPKFQCAMCKGTAKSEDNLCRPEKIE